MSPREYCSDLPDCDCDFCTAVRIDERARVIAEFETWCSENLADSDSDYERRALRRAIAAVKRLGEGGT